MLRTALSSALRRLRPAAPRGMLPLLLAALVAAGGSAAAGAEPASPRELPSGLHPAADTTPADSTPAEAEASSAAEHAGHASSGEPGAATAWRMPPMRISMPMLPPLEGAVPPVEPFLPGAGMEPSAVAPARPTEVAELADGDTLRLRAETVRRTVRGETFVMYGFNGQVPGPLLRVPQEATITVLFENRIELPSTVHWHGLRLENRFDGVPEVTQEPVPPGGDFVYRLHFPDPGIYWYHPHVRTDLQQDAGLYGNIRVEPPGPDYYNPVNREAVLVLDDLLVDDRGLFPWGAEASVHTLMGRFGNVFLVNGEPDYRISVKRGAVVRFFLTNVSNTRTYNLSFGGAPMKVVAADVSRYEREERVASVVIGPAQRYVVETRFPEAGTVPIVNRVRAMDHFRGEFYPEVDTLGTVEVAREPVETDHAASFRSLRSPEGVAADIQRYRRFFDRPPDHELLLTVRVGDLPRTIVNVMAMDTLFRPPMEWNDAMPMMNYLSAGTNVEWILRDRATGRENMEIHWTFREGDVVKIRIHNDARSFHPMQHPIHLHGQRFLVLEQDGVPNENLVWRDTAIVPVGSTVDLLVDMSNPGDWLLHCHISEHIEAGMKTAFTVEETGRPDLAPPDSVAAPEAGGGR